MSPGFEGGPHPSIFAWQADAMQGVEGSFARYCLGQGVEGGTQGSCRRNLEAVGGKASPCH